MSYELVLVPMDYTKHLRQVGATNQSTCTMCNNDLELIEEFLNVAGMPHTKTEFESIFSICPDCGTAHLELVSGIVDFKGPVLIGWE
ncbi:hypothetical protein COJ01_17995 [Priestia megaterium]|uniref:hypothetical protein n=1 Tax=Priestia megaterium TaxID=1404 RepID=UPI000BFA0782|nr:hypothetical protein [Priestia megaterium]PFK99938.1 hypothetical protein COJ01_17995 [Priestia megaterium]